MPILEVALKVFLGFLVLMIIGGVLTAAIAVPYYRRKYRVKDTKKSPKDSGASNFTIHS